MRLHINIDHVATLRNQRDVSYPDPLAAARICMEAGADGITVHLREDRRHIRDSDVWAIKRAGLGVLNLEMAATAEMAAIAAEVRPDVVTLVPEKREERTTEGGLDVVTTREQVGAIASMCREREILLSLFIEANEEQVRASQELGATQVEFHTGHFCDANGVERDAILRELKNACHLADELGLQVALGHGLTRENVGELAAIPTVQEFNIGHSVIADAVLVGMGEAVRGLRAAINEGRAAIH